MPAVREGVLSHQQAAIASDPTLPPRSARPRWKTLPHVATPWRMPKRSVNACEADVPTLKAALDEEGPALQARLQDYQQRMAKALEKESAGAQQAVQSLLQRNQQRLQQPQKARTS